MTAIMKELVGMIRVEVPGFINEEQSLVEEAAVIVLAYFRGSEEQYEWVRDVLGEHLGDARMQDLRDQFELFKEWLDTKDLQGR